MKGDYMKPGLHSDGQYRSRPLGKLCLSPCKGPGTWCTYTPALFKWVWIQRKMSRRDKDLTEPTWLRQPIGRKRERGGWGGRPSGQVESLEEGSTRSSKHTVDCRMTIQQMNYLCQSLASLYQDLPPDHYHQPQVFHPCWCSFPPPSQPGRCSEPEMGVAWHTLCRSSPRRSWTDESCRMRQSALGTCHQELTPGQGGVRGTNPHTQHTARKTNYFKVSLRGGCSEVYISPKIYISAWTLKMAQHKNPGMHYSRVVIFLHGSSNISARTSKMHFLCAQFE